MSLEDAKRLRNYGVAFSDAEGSWPAALKAQMKKTGQAIVMAALGPWQKLRFLWAFLKARRRARNLDLSSLRAKGMTNEAFLATQLEYLSLFSALVGIIGQPETIALMKKVMDETAREALLLCLPAAEEMQRLEDPFETFRRYIRAAPPSACKAGCQKIEISEDSPQAIQMDVTWCVWLELARQMAVPEGCEPNCYADDLVFPAYFADFGILYKRTQTLATGGCRCDFRFERQRPKPPPETAI